MVSVCLPSDALLQHLPSYLGFSYLGRGVSLHGSSSKAQPLLLTLDERYLLTTTLPDLQCGIAPLGPPVPAQPWLRVTPLISNAWKWKVKVKSLSRVQLFATPWAAVHQAPPSMRFSRQEYWSGVPLPSPTFVVKIGQISHCFPFSLNFLFIFFFSSPRVCLLYSFQIH